MLRDCLNSIQNTIDVADIEVIVVDNASTDGAVAMIQSEFPWVKLILSKERNGFAHNQNVGIQNSNGDYVLILNDDTILRPGALELLCRKLDEDALVAVAAPKLLNKDGSVQESCYRFPTPLRHVWDNLLLAAAFPHHKTFGDYRKWTYDEEREVDCVKGAALMVRRSAIDAVGLLDEQFYFYFEEIDWQLRMHQAGYKIVFCPAARITHLGGQSLAGESDRLFSEFQTSSRKFVLKHYGMAGAAVQNLAIVYGALLSITIWSMIKPFSKNKQSCSAQVSRSANLLRWWLGVGQRIGINPLN